MGLYYATKAGGNYSSASIHTIPGRDYAATKKHVNEISNEISIVTLIPGAFARLSSSACSDRADVGSIV
jgi:hypothetical protein